MSSAKSGSITVFLSLIMLIVMGLIGTMTEVARGKICRIHGRRTLQSAADSLLAEYSRPLYNEYRLFFLEDVGKPFEQSIAEYAAATLNPGQLPEKQRQLPGVTDLYDGTLQGVDILQKRYAGDGGGIALQEQICAYMKRQLAADALSRFTASASPLKGVEQSAGEIENQAAREKKSAENSRTTLELMKKVDGVDCSGGGIQAQPYFVKMFCPGEMRSETLGITESRVWNRIKEKVVSLEDVFARLSSEDSVRKSFLRQVTEAEKVTQQAERLAKSCSDGREMSAALQGNREILSETKSRLSRSLNEEEAEEIKKLWKNYNVSGIAFDYTGLGEEGGGKNPMKHFSGLISGGILSLVIPEGTEISKKEVGNPDNYFQLYAKREPEGKDYEGEIQNFAENEEVSLTGAMSDVTRIAATDFYLIEYIKRYFSSFIHSVGKKNRLDYELEYIIYGGASDEENLAQMVNRMVMMRTVINAGVIFSSAEKREEAYAAALAVVGFTGMEPLIRFTQTLFIVLWGMAESIVDVAGILGGKHVPLIKSESSFSLTFPELFTFSRTAIQQKVKKMPEAAKTDFGYEKYLALFLLANKKDTICYRMMDLMEWNIRENYVKGFSLGMCVDAFSVRGQFTFDTKFFRFPFVQDILDRQMRQFNAEAPVKASYIRA